MTADAFSHDSIAEGAHECIKEGCPWTEEEANEKEKLNSTIGRPFTIQTLPGHFLGYLLQTFTLIGYADEEDFAI